MNVEHGIFTPLVFTVLGGMGQENEKYHKHIADKIATKSEDDYSKVVDYIRCKVAFIVLRSALLCLRGSRTIRKEKIVAVAEDIAVTMSFSCKNVWLGERLCHRLYMIHKQYF